MGKPEKTEVVQLAWTPCRKLTVPLFGLLNNSQGEVFSWESSYLDQKGTLHLGTSKPSDSYQAFPPARKRHQLRWFVYFLFDNFVSSRISQEWETKRPHERTIATNPVSLSGAAVYRQGPYSNGQWQRTDTDTKHHAQPTGKQKVKAKNGKKHEPKIRMKGKDRQAGSKTQNSWSSSTVFL